MTRTEPVRLGGGFDAHDLIPGDRIPDDLVGGPSDDRDDQHRLYRLVSTPGDRDVIDAVLYDVEDGLYVHARRLASQAAMVEPETDWMVVYSGASIEASSIHRYEVSGPADPDEDGAQSELRRLFERARGGEDITEFVEDLRQRRLSLESPGDFRLDVTLQLTNA